MGRDVSLNACPSVEDIKNTTAVSMIANNKAENGKMSNANSIAVLPSLFLLNRLKKLVLKNVIFFTFNPINTCSTAFTAISYVKIFNIKQRDIVNNV